MHVLWVFSDGAFHAECFHKHPLAKEAQADYEEMSELYRPGSNICVVCNRELRDPDDYFAVGHLVEDARHSLYPYTGREGAKA